MARIAVVGAVGVGLVFSLDRQPVEGETLIAEGLRIMPGGKAGNHAIGLAFYGHEVRLISATGKDAFAEQIENVWHHDGIDASGVVQILGESTLVGTVHADRNGDNRVVIGPSAMDRFTPAHVDEMASLITTSDILLVSLEMPAGPAKRALEIAKAAGVLTVLNPAPAPSTEHVSDLVSLCEWVTPNEGEAISMTGSRNVSIAASVLRDLGATNVVITLGTDGALLVTDLGEEHIPSRRVIASDTSGAGDAFNVAFVDGLARGLSADDAVRCGCEAGALIVQGPGFVDALPLLSGLVPTERSQ